MNQSDRNVEFLAQSLHLIGNFRDFLYAVVGPAARRDFVK